MANEDNKPRAAFTCVKDTLDGAYPALVMALNAVRQGMETKIFYSFAGLNIVKKGGPERAKFFMPGAVGAIPGMSALATSMMKKKIDKAEIPNLSELIEMSQLEGVELIACDMAINILEVNKDDLIEGVSIWNADDFLKYARTCEVCLFT